MTFLNAALAFGAAACAIPVVIHLLNRRRHEIVRWGAMHLITPIVRTNRKRVRLEQLLLLLMRMAILALLALCMAGPVLTNWNALSGNAKTSLAMLFDNSYSMDASSGVKTNSEHAKSNAAQLVLHQPRGSDVAVSMMAGGHVTGSFSPTTNRKRIADDLKEIPGGFGAADVGKSFEHATRSLVKMQHAKRDLVIVSDFQQQDWAGDAGPTLVKAKELIDAMPIRPTITLMQVGAEATDNISIQSIELTPSVVAIDQPVNIRVNLRNHGEIPYPRVAVNMQVDGQDRESQSIDLAAGEDGQLLFRHSFAEAGSHVLNVFAEADALHMDNTYKAVVQVWDRLPVLLVDGSGENEALKSSTGFLRLALSPFLSAAGLPDGTIEQTLPRADLLDARVVKHDDLTPADLANLRVLVLANVPRLESDMVDAIKAFVAAGNSLLVFSGDQIDSNWYQTDMCERAGLIPVTYGVTQDRKGPGTNDLLGTTFGDPQQVGDANAPQVADDDEASKKPELGARIAATRFEHPVLAYFNDGRNGNLSDARITTWHRLFTPQLHIASSPLPGDDEAEARAESTGVIARLEGGDPLMIEGQLGKGRVIVCATDCGDKWTNLPARPFYLPLMQRLVTYLAIAVEPRRNLAAGQTIVAPFTDNPGTVIVTRPDGKQVELKEKHREDPRLVEYSGTDQEGVYTLQTASMPLMHYVVVADRVESNLKRLDQDEMTTLAESLDATVVASADEFIQQDSKRRYGREIWRPLYWAMFVLVIAELLLQQWLSGIKLRSAGGGAA